MITEDEFVIKEIIGHKFLYDSFLYNVSVNGQKDPIWINETDISESNQDLLKEYKEKITTNTNEEEIEYCHPIPDILINFNEIVGIKLEVNYNATPLAYEEGYVSEEDHLNLIPKSEPKVDEALKDINQTLELLDDPTTQISNIKSLVSDNSSVNIVNNNESNCQILSVASLHDTQPINFNNIIDQKSTNNEKSDKSKNIPFGKLKKSSKTRTEDSNVKYAGDLHRNEIAQSKNSKLAEAFAKISVVEKFNAPVIYPDDSLDKLKPLTKDIFKLIILHGKLRDFLIYIESKEYSSQLKEMMLLYGDCILQVIRHKHYHLLTIMLANGCNIEYRDENGFNALMYACEMNDENLILLLVSSGASMNMKPDGSNKILYWCITNGKAQALKTLLNLGANFTDIFDQRSLSVSEYAAYKKHGEIEQIFKHFHDDLMKKLESIVHDVVGRSAKIEEVLIPPHMYALHEHLNDIIDIKFQNNIQPVLENKFNMLFLIEGVIDGDNMVYNLSGVNRVVSVVLNEVKQQNLIDSTDYLTLTSLSPLNLLDNVLSIKYQYQCNRKVRLVVFGVRMKLVTD